MVFRKWFQKVPRNIKKPLLLKAIIPLGQGLDHPNP